MQFQKCMHECLMRARIKTNFNDDALNPKASSVSKSDQSKCSPEENQINSKKLTSKEAAFRKLCTKKPGAKARENCTEPLDPQA